MANNPGKFPDREARLAEALRANLRRRKAQSRAKANDKMGALSESPDGAPESDGQAETKPSPDPGPNPAQKRA